jgi:hypothetical protein
MSLEDRARHWLSSGKTIDEAKDPRACDADLFSYLARHRQRLERWHREYERTRRAQKSMGGV